MSRKARRITSATIACIRKRAAPGRADAAPGLAREAVGAGRRLASPARDRYRGARLFNFSFS
jgi:hypothetical protein